MTLSFMSPAARSSSDFMNGTNNSGLNSQTSTTIGADGVQEVTRYVEVPMVEEVVTTVPKRETVEVEKRFQRTETEYLDRVIEVPTVKTVRKIVEKPVLQEVIKTVIRKEVIAVPTEVIKYVTRKETRVIEEEKKVKGEVIEVPKIIDVIREVIVPRYHDSDVPTIVAQTVVPIVSDEGGEESVECCTYEPYLIPVDIYIPKPVDRPIVCEGKANETLKNVDVPPPQYNVLLRNLNSEIISDKQIYRDMPFKAQSDGSIHFLGQNSESSLQKMASSGIPLHHLASKRDGSAYDQSTAPQQAFQTQYSMASVAPIVAEARRNQSGVMTNTHLASSSFDHYAASRQESNLSLTGQKKLDRTRSSSMRRDRSTSASGTRMMSDSSHMISSQQRQHSTSGMTRYESSTQQRIMTSS